MRFKTGDIVSFLNHVGSGVVLEVESDQVLVETEYGFEEWFDEKDLVPRKSMPIGEVQQKDEVKFPSNQTETHGPNQLIKDLHFNQLVDFPKNFTNHQMLQIQLNEARNTIDKARRGGIKKVILIHGVGEGRLREEIHSMLERMDRLTFYDASYHQFGEGATEIELF